MIATAMPARSISDLPQLSRDLCVICHQPVLWITFNQRLVLVDAFEYEPRAACQSCLHTRRAHPGRPVSCGRCGNSGMVGRDRPKGRMVAIDVAWSDDDEHGLMHIRIIGPRTDRRTGEALHEFHHCRERQAA